jgi:tetratricopeptide (TPR) repeat protein
MIKGKASKVCGEWKKALLFLAQSEDLAFIIEDKKLQVRAITESGHILEEQNELEKAMNFFKKGLSISKEINYNSGIGDSYRGIGRGHWRKSEHEEAIMNLRKSLEISERLGDSELMASINIDLGNIYDERYEIKEAIECYNNSLDILKKVKNTYETARVYGNLAITYEHLEDFDKAIEYNTKQLALAQNLHDMKLLGYGYAEMGYCFAKIKEFEKARQYTEKAERIASKLDNDNIMNLLNRTYGLISKYEGRWGDGEDYFNRNLKYLKNLGASYQLPDSHFELGLLYKELGDLKRAKKHLDTAVNLYADLGLEKNEHVKEKLSKC